MFDELKNLAKEKAAYEAKVKASGEKAIKSAVADFLKSHPEVKRIRWKQYTPYFNDGEPCVFRVGDVGAEVADGDPEGGDYGDGFLSSYSVEGGLKKTLGDFDSLLSEMEDALKVAFGDHVQITASATEIEIDEYEHD